MRDEGALASSPIESEPRVQRRYSELNKFVRARVRELQSRYLRGESQAAASLARLRRAVGKAPGADAVIWQETLALPDRYSGHGDEPSRAERAVHYALTLYATHQQSQATAMHRGGYGLGRAARQLGKSGASEQAVLRRFQALGTAASLTEAATHARGLVTQFRGAGIPLDYGQLAVDFTRFQDPRQIASVRLTWGRDYYRSYREDIHGGAFRELPTDPHDYSQGETS